MRKKQILARAFHYSGVTQVLRFLRSNYFQEIPVLLYHRVFNLRNYSSFPFNNKLVDATTNDFEGQMRYIKRYYNPISFKILNNYIKGNAKLPDRPVIISFDDGYDDNYHNAFPVLKKLDIPATIFLATGYIGKNKTFWYDWLAYIVLTNRQNNFEVPCIGFIEGLPGNVQQNFSVYIRCIEKLKKLPNETRLQALQEIESLYGQQYSSADIDIKKLSKPLTWEQCREMNNFNIEFGSHSVTHPILTSLKQDQLLFELKESKRMIEENIDQSVIALSFPNGRETDFNDVVKATAIKNGYDICVTAIPGIGRLTENKPMLLNRVIFDPRDDPYVFPLSLVLPDY